MPNGAPHGRRGSPGFAAIAMMLSALATLATAAETDSQAKMALGRKVFTQVAQPPCGLCHTLADAGTSGEIGARLEEIKPDEQRVLMTVRQGSGVMPAYADKLTPEQLAAVAHYVSQAVRGANP